MNTQDNSKAAEVVDHAITSRRAIRQFLPTLVPEQVVRDILAVASRAPSGTNMQPWRVWVVTGARKDALCKAMLALHESGQAQPAEYEYYPKPFPEPYMSRRRKLGWDMYGALGIKKGENQRMHEQHGRNFLYFDAPVGMVFTIDRVLKIGSWLDYGCFLQNIAIAARARGLDTCLQAAFSHMHTVLRAELDIPQSQIVVCGMSLGHADPEAPVNRFPVERLPVDEFAKFEGFRD